MDTPQEPVKNPEEISRLQERRDDSLIPYLQRGVRVAVTELERRYGVALRHRAAQLLDDPNMAEDMVQELMLLCCRGEEAKLPSAQLRAWLYKSLRNRCMDELRKRRVRKARRLDEPTPSLVGDMPPDTITSPGSKAANREQSKAIRELLEQFDPKLREVLVLRYFEHRSREEIAERLGISHSVVKARLVKAVAKLREMTRSDSRG